MTDTIAADKKDFITILTSIQRKGADIDKLLSKLEHSDFYAAPASAKFHNSMEGGLLAHSLNVFYNLMHLVKYKYPDVENCPISEDSIKIVALLHDISKMNLYEKTFSNKKIYCEDGDKIDENGKFKWVSVQGYSVKSSNDRFIFGSHENTSEYMVRQFIPLTVEESVAINHHMGGTSWDSAKDNIAEIYNHYPLATLLHIADCLATYVDEKDTIQ